VAPLVLLLERLLLSFHLYLSVRVLVAHHPLGLDCGEGVGSPFADHGSAVRICLSSLKRVKPVLAQKCLRNIEGRHSLRPGWGAPIAVWRLPLQPCDLRIWSPAA